MHLVLEQSSETLPAPGIKLYAVPALAYGAVRGAAVGLENG